MKLLEPHKIGNVILSNRMAMAPMTRSRANMEGVVGASTVLYYTQRASAGLIISEAINISKQAIGSPLTPGLYTRDQINAWKNVTQAVHEKGGKIYFRYRKSDSRCFQYVQSTRDETTVTQKFKFSNRLQLFFFVYNPKNVLLKTKFLSVFHNAFLLIEK